MIPSSFKYNRVSSVSEALSLMSEHGDNAKILAGGHSLVPTLKLRLSEVDHLIDISRVPELKGIAISGDEITIGAGVTHAEIAKSQDLSRNLPIMCEAAEQIGDIQVRNFGTIGGSIAHADPAADWPAVLIACEAVIHLQSQSGSRSVNADEFFHGLFSTAMNENEMITSIRLPVPADGSKGAYVKYMQPASRFAVVGCAVMVSSGKARVAINGASATPFRDKGVEAAVEGGSDAATAAANAGEGQSMMSDHFASEEYRAHLLKVQVKRALEIVA